MRLTGEEIRVRGLAALRKALGRSGLARFLRHYELGKGNYTIERRTLLKDLTADELRSRIGPRPRSVRRPR